MASITLDAERRVHADTGRVRVTAVDVLRSLGFQITSEMATVVEARRGSAVRSAMLLPDQVPLAARLHFAPVEDERTAVSLHLTDRAISVIALGVQDPYVAAFQAALLALDQALGGLDPTAAGAGFPPPRWWTRAPRADGLARHHETGQRFVGGVAARVNERLSGGRRSTGPSLWEGIERIVFRSPAGYLAMDMATARSLLAIPVMIGSRPQGVPDQLAADVARLAAVVEGGLSSGGLGSVEVAVAEADRPAFEFLHRQFGIRSRLPVRTLCTCRDCRQTKVVNLDLKRLRQRKSRLKTIASVVQTTYEKDGDPNPFLIFGSIFQQSRIDPDFVCVRCESTVADEQPVTFCPSCGDMRTESVLDTCSECGHDFQALAADLPAWGAAPPPPLAPPVPPAPPAAPPPPPPVAPPMPAAPPAPGFTAPRPSCGICGGSYPVLWSVQVLDGPHARPLTVCAATPRCSPPSVAPPVRIRV
ncbi:hypothetical protein ACFWP2_21220 [Kitasatospora sp. NPDC058444]|uniref:hypothetical protein n=1 Tax=Kitasatospora sp. NPDC058444 TaxID=3346504 RepID=UPI00366653CE